MPQPPPLPGAPRPAPAPTAQTRLVTLIAAVLGRRTGTAVFRIWLTGQARRFAARLNGRVSGKTGQRTRTVTEDFLYDDGQKDRLTYTADFKSLTDTTRLGFADLIHARPDDIIITDGVVSRAGIPVAAVRLVIR